MRTAINYRGGLLRIVLVIHYVIALGFAMFLCMLLAEGAQKGILIGAGLLAWYYITLETDDRFGNFFGRHFATHPMMTGLSLLWTDVCVGGASSYAAIAPFIPAEYQNASQILYAAGAWLGPIALVFGGWYLMTWVIAGFRSN